MKKFRVWVDVPHYVEVDADSEIAARGLAADKTFRDLTPGWRDDDLVGEEMQSDVEPLEVAQVRLT